jgi:hypothetical protein
MLETLDLSEGQVHMSDVLGLDSESTNASPPP